MKRLTPAVLAVLLALTCTSCADRKELEDVAWAQAIGFDLHPEGLLTTIQVGIPSNIRTIAGAPGEGPRYVTISVLSKTALEAMDLAALSLGRTLSLVHCQLFVFGEELAKSDIRGLVSAMDRFREVRGSVTAAVALGKAADVLRTLGSPVELSASRALENLRTQQRETGLVDSGLFVRDLANLFESPSESSTCPLIALAPDYKPPQGSGQGGQSNDKDPVHQYKSTPDVGTEFPLEGIPTEIFGAEGDPSNVLPNQVPKVGGGPVIALGAAVFQGGKMVGTLTGEECRAMLLVKKLLQKAVFIVPDPQKPDDPQYSLGVEARGHGTDIKVHRNGDRVEFDVVVHLIVSYVSIKTQTDYSDPRNTPLAEQAIEDYIKNTIDRTVEKTQDLGSDVFGFGQKVRRTFLTYPEFENFAWLTKYPDAVIRTKVNVDIRRYGLDLSPLYVPPSEYMQKGQ